MFLKILFLLCPLLLDLLYLLSSDESDLLDDESDNDGSDSGSAGTCTFPFRFDESVGRVCGVGSGIFFPIEVDSKCDVFTFVMFVPIGVESKGGQIIEMFWRSNSQFSLQISK